MKIDFSQVLTDYDGREIRMAENVPATLRLVAVEGLMAPPRGNDPSGHAAMPSIDEVMRRDALARRIHAATEPVDLKSEDIVLLKERIAANFAPLAVATACRMLERESGSA